MGYIEVAMGDVFDHTHDTMAARDHEKRQIGKQDTWKNVSDRGILEGRDAIAN